MELRPDGGRQPEKSRADRSVEARSEPAAWSKGVIPEITTERAERGDWKENDQKPERGTKWGCACVAREVSVEIGGMGERGCARRFTGARHGL